MNLTNLQIKEKNIIEASEVFKKLGEKNIVLLDVRTKREHDQGHIPGSVSINWLEFFKSGKPKTKNQIKQTLSKKVDISKEIIVYCRSGARAKYVFLVLSKILGLKNVKLFSGSLIDWNKNNYPLE